MAIKLSGIKSKMEHRAMNMSDNQSALKTMQHTEGEGETEAKGRRTLFVYDLYSI